MQTQDEQLITEQLNEMTAQLDQLSVREALENMNREDKVVAHAVEEELDAITSAAETIIKALQKGGRLFYIGAGTSGRLGVLDASECPPTFNTSPNLVKGLIAGGETALQFAVEGIEDSEEEGANDLAFHALSSHDVVVGIAASGRTPYVIGGLRYANEKGADTISLSCNPDTPISKLAQTPIDVIVGPEILSGSTRLKSGTAQKMVLNMLSTVAMVQMGKVYQNLMVDVQATNQKLKNRAVRILQWTTDVNKKQAVELLTATDWKVKEAIVMEKTHLDLEKVNDLLQEADGKVAEAIEAAHDNGGGVES
ncbi:N-acetylmuramic acid 6-phosphate etherase [Thalassobacillus sp. CUG 92003]|uniref:N-acetylmuramic acid 6-phosphate etherase n=1 Tax=Thalassobacillus sp. CUG 92003 TaxID=2736641 RepID=UPI0015E6FABD|nr:N-acetylmuramic acid 6-phosphate etherase [Thalassobacillus sp. CUG 92003]